MGTGASKCATWSQLSLAALSTLCVMLHPGFVLKWDEGGFSNYGVHVKTAAAYTLAFVLCAWFAALASRRLRATTNAARTQRRVLVVYAVLMVLTLVSTYGYTIDRPLKDVHTAVGILTMLFEPLTSLWMYSLLKGSKWRRVLLTTVLAGLTLGVVDFVGLLHVLFLAQVLTGVGFGFLLVQSVSRLDQLAVVSAPAPSA